MKNIKNIILVIAFQLTLSCQSQTPIYTIGESPANKAIGSYIKDTNNTLNKFVGTWTFNQNSQVFTITLQKAEMVNILNEYYKDMIKGSYVYSINNSIIVNTENFTGDNSKITGAMIWRDEPNKLNVFFASGKV